MSSVSNNIHYVLGNYIQQFKDDRITQLGNLWGICVIENVLWLAGDGGLTRVIIEYDTDTD